MKAGTRTLWTFVMTSIAFPRSRRSAEASSHEPERLVAPAEAA